MLPVLIYGLAVALLLVVAMLGKCLQTIGLLQKAQERSDFDLRAMRNDITAVGRGAIGVGKRVQTLQQRLQTTERRQEDMEHKDIGNIAFSHASKLVQMGAPTDELVSTCGLSQAEADLIALMHVRSKEAPRSAA